MTIAGVRTEFDVSIQATTLKTDLAWWMEVGTAKGQSSDLAAGLPTTYLGKALEADGDRAGKRTPRVAKNGRQALP
ncbi:MAG: hypothetical protein GY881_03740 [Gammaproteobacteria bacterium]|nr:hypothetical protein [Gammaproteobacteria bacterium]